MYWFLKVKIACGMSLAFYGMLWSTVVNMIRQNKTFNRNLTTHDLTHRC